MELIIKDMGLCFLAAQRRVCYIDFVYGHYMLICKVSLLTWLLSNCRLKLPFRVVKCSCRNIIMLLQICLEIMNRTFIMLRQTLSKKSTFSKHLVEENESHGLRTENMFGFTDPLARTDQVVWDSLKCPISSPIFLFERSSSYA